MPSEYIKPNEYTLYGLPTTTTQPQVYQASLLVDSYLRRPEGMVWEPDSFGMPCYMAAYSPDVTFKSAGSIAPGASVAVGLTVQVPLFESFLGRVAILDRADPALVEAAVVEKIATGQLTFANVVNSHNANCTIEFGLTIREERSIPNGRAITRVARPPVRILSGMGRYGYGRRTDQMLGEYNELNLLAAVQTFGGPPVWQPFPINQASYSEMTREVWVPAGLLMAYYSDVRLEYVSGYAYSAL